MRFVDGVVNVCLASLRGVGAGSVFPGPLEELCFRFFEWWSSLIDSGFLGLFEEDSADFNRPYSLYLAAVDIKKDQPRFNAQHNGDIIARREVIFIPILGSLFISFRSAFLPPFAAENALSHSFSSARSTTDWDATSELLGTVVVAIIAY